MACAHARALAFLIAVKQTFTTTSTSQIHTASLAGCSFIHDSEKSRRGKEETRFSLHTTLRYADVTFHTASSSGIQLPHLTDKWYDDRSVGVVNFRQVACRSVATSMLARAVFKALRPSMYGKPQYTLTGLNHFKHSQCAPRKATTPPFLNAYALLV